MRKTLLAVGFAVLVSMLATPHAREWQFLDQTFGGYNTLERSYPQYNVLTARYEWKTENYPVHWDPRWCGYWYWFPIFWLEDRNPILWASFAGQTAFAAVLVAVVVNLRERRTHK